jgi:hypothetical protein
MPIFKDPIQTLSVEVPSGWTYDSLSSSLTNFFFARWDRPEEIFAVRIRKAVVPENETDEQWVEQIQRELGESHPLADFPSGGRRAIAATFVSSMGLVQRVVFVRGSRVDLAIEQRSTELKVSDAWSLLHSAVQTAASAANEGVSSDFGPEDFNRCIEAANQAFEKQDHSSVMEALNAAVHTGTLIWLQSLAVPEGELEINAAVRVAQAMIHMGRFAGNHYLLRDAEFILLRAQRTLEDAGQMEADRQIAMDLKEALDSILADFLEPRDPKSDEPLSPILAMRERGFRSTQAAVNAFEACDWVNASGFAKMAMDDLLSLICFLRRNRSQPIPEDISAHLKSQGITNTDDQRTALQNAREAILFPPLNMSLQIRHYCGMERQDAESTTAAVTVLLPVARLLFNADANEPGIALSLALALISSSGTVALSGGEAEIEEAARYLDEADQLLRSLGDQSYADDGWFRYHDKQIEIMLRAFDSISPERDTASLQSLRSRFTEVSGRLQEVIARLTPADKSDQ